MAFVLDPGGAAVALWQANKHIGATLVNEPGTVMWNELITSNSAAPKFYERVLGMTTAPMDDPTMGPYTLFMVNGEMVGGTTAPQSAGEPSRWHVYFAVADAGAAAAKIAELGGTVLAGPFDTPVGRMAVAADPQDAAFSIIQPPAGQPG
jgi:predicted enzyme related to lactoylglutathione lyase